MLLEGVTDPSGAVLFRTLGATLRYGASGRLKPGSYTSKDPGECIKKLRPQRRIDAGTDKILEGLWAFAISVPGVRHGSGMPSDLSVRDWQIIGPMVDGALILLLSIDSAN